MQQKIPFLQLFSAFRGPDSLMAEVARWELTGAQLNERARTIKAQVFCAVLPSEEERQEAEDILRRTYRLERLEVTFSAPEVYDDAPLPEPPPEEDDVPLPEPPSEEPSGDREPPDEDPFAKTEAIRQAALKNLRPAAPREKGNKKPNGKLIFGRREIKIPKTGIVPMGSVDLDMGVVTVEGDVFAVDHREKQQGKAWVVKFDLTDYTGSIRVTKFFLAEEAKPLVERVHEGQRLLVQGRLTVDRYTNETILEPYAVAETEKPVRTDTAPGEKRVELHLHTNMSAIDALTPTAAAVKRAESWGHRAIAITDHGVTHSFPDAWHAAKCIKILYGLEAYFVNDVDDQVAVHGDCGAQDFHGEIVCFDIETTGLHKNRDRIIEIGAVVLRDGQVAETFNTFASPGMELPRKIVELTGITDQMLEGAPGQDEAVNAFLDFAGDRPLAAHNASFDMGFIAQACRNMGREFRNPSVDSLVLAQDLLPDLPNFKLDTVANRLNLPAFNHHRASDDAATVAYMLVPFFRTLEERGIGTLSAINGAMIPLRLESRTRFLARKGKWQPNHLILLAQNQLGLRNLNHLISDSFLKHFHRGKPILLKSEIDMHREGLILGSACEAGELYRVVTDRKEWDELLRVASWYDYLEIQPVCNNAFMLRREMVESEEEIRDFNRTVLALGKALDKPVCATGDVHFLEPQDEIYRHILLDSKGFEDCDEPLPIYFKTTDEMLEEFSYLGEEDCRKVVIRDPNLIADMCDRMDPLPKGLFAPKLKDSDKELENLVYGKAHELYGEELPQIVQDRIDLELPGIIKRKYDVIYMSAQKLVQNSLEHGYLVGSRGSVGSSLVAFLSGITEVNSLPPHYRCPKCKHVDFDYGPQNGYDCGADMPDAHCPLCGTLYKKDGFNIPFETFLGFGGDKVPDIDLNFSGEYQSKAHRYTFELFGETHVFRAGTVSAVKDKVAFGYVKNYLEKRGLRVNAAEAERLVNGCTGVKKTTGQHPGGMVVIPQDKEIYDFCPVQHPADDAESDVITTHYEYHSMEPNLLKLDMLGHVDPTMIHLLEELTGVNARTDIPLDDPDAMSIFTSSEKLGYSNDPILGPTGAVAIPEFNTSFTRQVLLDTDPHDLNTLIRISGYTHGTDVWLGNAKDLIKEGISPAETVGCRDDIMLYLIKKGLEPKTAFKIMEAVRKGKVKKGGFQEGWAETMREHDVPDWYIDSLAKIAYLFPKAHAVAYVMMAFRIAWYKVHRPLAFYAAFFSVRAKAFDETIMCRGMDTVKAKMKEIRAKMDDKKASGVEEDTNTTLEVVYEFYLRGFTFKNVDIYRSDATRFRMEGDRALIPPFTAIPGLGETAAQSIVEQREGKEFVSIEEFSAACPKVSKTHIEQLKAAGAFGDLAETSQITLF